LHGIEAGGRELVKKKKTFKRKKPDFGGILEDFPHFCRRYLYSELHGSMLFVTVLPLVFVNFAF